MKTTYISLLSLSLFFTVTSINAQTVASNSKQTNEQLFMDVHELGAGKVTFDAVSKAHARDLAVEDKHGVHFLKYWVDESKGKVYCLSTAPNEEAIRATHAEAHGLAPKNVYPVSGGEEATLKSNIPLFMDVHYFGPGKVSSKDVAGAHEKDLATQGKYGVNFINYWVDEKEGVVFCLSNAKNAAEISHTHKEAHGLLPLEVLQVKQGE